MVLIPYQRFEIKTNLSQEAARKKLASIVEPRQLGWRFSKDHNWFEGELTEQTFKISRIIRYRNSFLPTLEGTIQDDLDSASLQITARPNWFIIILWPLLIIILFYSVIFSAGVTNIGLILLFIAFFYGLPTVLFNMELNNAKKLLNKAFERESEVSS